MKSMRLIALLMALVVAGLSVVHAGGSNLHTAEGGAFRHIARNGGPDNNVAAHVSHLVSEYPTANTSPMTDSNPNAVIFATHNVTFTTENQWSPFGVFNHQGRWGIFNLNGFHFVGGAAFNIQVQSKGHNVFVHKSTPENVSTNSTYIDHPLTNGNASALINITPRGNTLHDHYLGVWYNILVGKWAIFNQDKEAMPAGLEFNVHVLQDPEVDFLHIVTPQNKPNGTMTELDHPMLNENVEAQIIVTPNYGSLGQYNDNPIGVMYDNASKKWNIVNVNGGALADGMMFNVHIARRTYTGDGLLRNGSFEVASAEGNKFPVNWNTSAAGKGSKRVCNKYEPKAAVDKILSNNGECSFMLKGVPGENRKLKQKVNVASEVNFPLANVSLWVKSPNVSGLAVKVKVKLDDGTKIGFALPVDELNGSYDWKQIGNARLLPPGTAATKLTVTVRLNGSGKVYIDDAVATVEPGI